ncbi:heavy metal-binding domain-containing protein [Clostridium sp. D33t1_170424_F3]|uniref:heavy metal-binding domain-containing protein n=1 Tax=Clostridium sp. D33t1_170424_F3 TaxID=2787099 RepID=UPI0018AB50A1|nr:heavy metal-binding domain-containing protein [Clostridium sp. D33t1_170424_F3]
MGSIMLTPGFDLKGYNIVEYLGCCTGEILLTEGDLTGATKAAIGRMEEEAAQMGANAVIGMNVQYSNFREDMTFVVANGTAVKAEQLRQDPEAPPEILYTLPVTNYNPELPFQMLKVRVRADGAVQLLFAPIKNSKITALSVHLYFVNIFGETILFKQVPFLEIKNTAGVCYTEACKLDFPYGVLGQFASAVVSVRKYVRNGLVYSCKKEDKDISLDGARLQELRIQYGQDVVSGYVVGVNTWTCLCGKENDYSAAVCERCGREKGLFQEKTREDSLQTVLEQAKQLGSVKEIWNYMLAYQKENGNSIPNAVMTLVRDSAALERLYGNQKEDCIRKLVELVNK